MNKAATNLIVLLGIILFAFGGYFFLTQDSQMFSTSSTSDEQIQRLLASSQLFVERSRILSNVELDTQIFDSEIFNSLKSFSPPPDEYSVGRSNPFAPTTAPAPVNTSGNQ